MKIKILYAAIFLCVPIGILITAILHRHPRYQGVVWFDEIRLPGKTNTNAQNVEALNALEHMGKVAVPMLQEKLKTSQGYEKSKAAWVLGQMGTTASNAIPDLNQALDDKDIGVQTYSFKSLLAIGTTSEDVALKLIPKLYGTNLVIRCLAAELLDKIEWERKAQNLPPLSGDPYERAMAFVRSSLPSIRVKGAYRLAHLPPGDERVTMALQSLLNDTNGWVRQQTAVFMKHPNAIQPELMNTAQSP